MSNIDKTIIDENANIAAKLERAIEKRGAELEAQDTAKGAPALQPEHILQYFVWAHLPPDLQEISRPYEIMTSGVMRLPRNPERTESLRKLLESKDAAVRAARFVEHALDAAEVFVIHGCQPEDYARVLAHWHTVQAEDTRQCFAFSHLPPELQEVSRPFGELADRLMQLPACRRRTVALDRLLEAKDAAVRARFAR